MVDIEYTGPPDVDSTTLDLWSSLPEELSNPSFFMSSAEHALILDLFVDAVKSGNTRNLDILLSSTLLSSPMSLHTLLALVWTSVSISMIVRITALQRFTQCMGTGTALDFQGFIPHLIAALSDQSKDIRDAAAKAITALHETYSASTKHSVVELMDMYPEDTATTTTLKWLSSAEAKWLVGSNLLPKLAECRLDCNYVVRLLGGILNGAGKKGKKEQYHPHIGYLI
jgi:HEAT repeat